MRVVCRRESFVRRKGEFRASQGAGAHREDAGVRLYRGPSRTGHGEDGGSWFVVLKKSLVTSPSNCHVLSALRGTPSAGHAQVQV